MKYKIHLDLDGVFCDFDESIEEKFKDNTVVLSLKDELKKAKELVMRLYANDLKKFINENEYVDGPELLKTYVKYLQTSGLEVPSELKAWKKLSTKFNELKFKIAGKRGFFLNLKPMSSCHELFDFVSTVDPNPTFLTAPIGDGNIEKEHFCAEEKRAWVDREFAGRNFEFICTGDKWKYAKSDNPDEIHILIDDRGKYIKPWISHGGVGILHTSVENSIQQLKKIIENNNTTSESILRNYVKQMISEHVKY